MRPSDPVPPRWRRRKDARPGEILAAALDVFADKGFAAARLEDIAARAGVTKGTLYLYFEGKEALLRAIVTEAVLPSVERLEALIDAHQGSMRDFVRGPLARAWRVLIDAKVARLPKVMIAEAANFPAVARHFHDTALSRIFGLHRRILARGIATGEFRVTDQATTAMVIQSQILFLALWTHDLGPAMNETVDPDQYIATTFDILLDGLARKEPIP